MKKTQHFFFLLTIVFCLMQQDVSAQQISLSNQYIVNKLSLSPAYAGAGDNFGIFGSYRRDWIGVTGAPETKIISANGNVCKNMGLGGSITSIQAGIFTNLSAMLQYAYHVKFSGTSFLSIGLGLGVLENHLDLSNNETQIDPTINNMDRTSSMIDISAGILFRHKNLHLGISAPRLRANQRPGKESYFLWPHRQAHLSYKLAINKIWAIDPIMVVYLPKDAPVFYEVAVPIIYQQKVWLTLAHKKTCNAVGIGTNLKANFVLNYTYEFSGKGMAQGTGTHEITLGWKMSNKKSGDQTKSDKKKPYLEWINK